MGPLFTAELGLQAEYVLELLRARRVRQSLRRLIITLLAALKAEFTSNTATVQGLK